jgi:hypothetical protein
VAARFPDQHTSLLIGERGMMTLHDFVVQLLLIVSPAAILILIEIDGRH